MGGEENNFFNHVSVTTSLRIRKEDDGGEHSNVEGKRGITFQRVHRDLKCDFVTSRGPGGAEGSFGYERASACLGSKKKTR